MITDKYFKLICNAVHRVEECVIRREYGSGVRRDTIAMISAIP